MRRPGMSVLEGGLHAVIDPGDQLEDRLTWRRDLTSKGRSKHDRKDEQRCPSLTRIGEVDLWNSDIVTAFLYYGDEVDTVTLSKNVPSMSDIDRDRRQPNSQRYCAVSPARECLTSADSTRRLWSVIARPTGPSSV